MTSQIASGPRDCSDRFLSRMWRELPERFNRPGEDFKNAGDVIIRIKTAKAKSDGTAGEFVVSAEGPYDRRGFQRTGRAGGPFALDGKREFDEISLSSV